MTESQNTKKPEYIERPAKPNECEVCAIIPQKVENRGKLETVTTNSIKASMPIEISETMSISVKPGGREVAKNKKEGKQNNNADERSN